MLLNLYLFTSVQSKAFVLPFCIYEPLAHEAIFFFFFFFSKHNYVQGLPFSSERALHGGLCGLLSVFPPRYHHIGVCCPLCCFGSSQKVLYQKPKKWGDMRT